MPQAEIERRFSLAGSNGSSGSWIALVRHVEIMRERVADHFRLLVDFLRHEMAMVALVDQHRRGRGFSTCRLTARPLASRIGDAVAAELDPVAFLQIADGVGEGRERDGVGAEIHLAVAIADRERRALARADQEVVLAGEQEGEREGAAQLRQRGGDCLGGRRPFFISR